MPDDFLLDPYSEAFARNPYRVYARMRQQQPIYYHAPWDAWIFSRYEDINRLLVDKRLGRTLDHVSTDAEISAWRRKHNWAAAPCTARKGIWLSVVAHTTACQ